MKTFRYSGVELLITLGLLFASAPVVEDLPHGSAIEAGLLTLVMVSAVVAVGGTRRTLTMALLLATPALAARWLHHLRPESVFQLIYMVSVIVFFLFVVACLLRFVLRAPKVDANVLCTGLSGYLLLGLLWMPAYLLIARLDPASFALSAGAEAQAGLDGFHAFYFSFITLCTVGYGDVTPVSKVARMLAVTEAISGLFYVTVLISRLVAIYSSPQLAADGEPPMPGRQATEPKANARTTSPAEL